MKSFFCFSNEKQKIEGGVTVKLHKQNIHLADQKKLFTVKNSLEEG